ncbi:MAG: flagellar hook-basal body complex protein, partial [Syntrophales bacterium]|nr:flagellar hook-basal body complex protein [Syntrophales bacterium]
EITPIFSQGSLETSADDVDVAITGTGFLIVKEPSTDSLYYTRDGNFSLNKDGYLVNAHGYRVQGKQMVNGTPSGVDTDIVIQQNFSNPKVTDSMDMVLNLNSNSVTGEAYSSALTVYDSVGNGHTVNLTFTKEAAADTWSITGTLDGTTAITIYDRGTTNPPTDMHFTSGTMDAGGDYDLVLDDPVMPGGVTTHLLLTGTGGGSTTQYAASSVTNYASQNGYGPGYLERISINNEGVITGNYSNGQIIPLYQLTLARFNAPTKLHREGSNMYTETQDSGVALTGAPSTNGLGSITSNSLEQSNVDLGEQFVHMIIYQRAFQANSRVITTSDTLLEEVLSLKR